MPVKKLPNYLRGLRKATGLSQKELAFLLGANTSGGVSRYERYVRTPTLLTALMLEAALGAPCRELFSGVYATAQETVARHARQLLKRSAGQSASRIAQTAMLKAIAGFGNPTEPISHD